MNCTPENDAARHARGGPIGNGFAPIIGSILGAMTLARIACGFLTLGAFLALPPAYAQKLATTRVDVAFQKFWAADSPAAAAKIADEVVKTGVTFDEALRRLKLAIGCSGGDSGSLVTKL